MIENELKLIKSQDTESSLFKEIESSKRKSLLDPLTGCWNKNGIDEIFKNELSKIKRNGGSLGLAMIDIDHFKKINDTYGHLEGDHILQAVAQSLRLSLRPYDYVCRYGGEEFIVLLPDSKLEGAVIAANRMLKNMSPDFITNGNLHIKVTASIGVSSFVHDSLLSKEFMVGKVDALLYKAKNNGRNQVVSY